MAGLIRVVSGGQTGVDRAALDAARACGLPRAGWCPRGRLAEDGRIDDRYPLRETPDADYAQRTEWNVRDSDATLVLLRGAASGGTAFTIEVARRLGRQLLVLELGDDPDPAAAHRWLRRERVAVLNVAGPRESQRPGIGGEAQAFLERLFRLASHPGSARTEAGFRHRFRGLLALVGPRRLDFGVELLLRRGRARAAREGTALAQGLAGVYEDTRRRVKRRLERTGCCWGTPTWSRFGAERPPRFLCDESLGGLARWLRAAGYEAAVAPGTPGQRLPAEALERGLVLLTSDAELLERRLVARGELLACWLPSGIGVHAQLAMVMHDFGLAPGEPRCMACGAVLVATAKDAVAERIPPRTARWLDAYFVCAGCGRLLWQGTHWQRIERALRRAAG